MTIKRRRRAPKAAPAKPVSLAEVLATGPSPPRAAETNDGKPEVEFGPVTSDLPEGEPAPRRRRKKLGMSALKLAAPERPGFTRRFFNDDRNRIADAHELGYAPVDRSQTSGLSSLDSRLVGTKAGGEPLQSILMETPDELYAEGLTEREAQAAAVDQAIMSGRDSSGQMSQIPQDERYGHVSMKRD